MQFPVRQGSFGLIAAALLLSACTPSSGASNASTTRSPSATTDPTTTSPTATPTPTEAVAPSRGAVLLSLQGINGTVIPNTAGKGFSVLSTTSTGGDSEQSTITSYDVAGRQVGVLTGTAATFTGECSASDVSTPDRRLFVTALVTSQPAQGINPATYAETLFAFDAVTGAQVWRADVVPTQPQPLQCGGTSSDGLDGFSATRDGAWGAVVVQSGNLSVVDAVDLRTGQLYPRPDLLGALGASLVTGPSSSDSNGPFTLTTPPQWQGQGSFSKGEDPGQVPINELSDLVSGRFTNSYNGNAGLSPDQTVLYASEPSAGQNGNGDGSVVTAYSLPAVTSLWKQDTTGQGITYSLVGAGANVLVVQRRSNSGTTTDGLDAKTGKTIWSLPGLDSICGLSSSEMSVQANGQVAVIDLATGKQIAYSGASSDSSTSYCSNVLPGGIAVTNDAVIQALDP